MKLTIFVFLLIVVLSSLKQPLPDRKPASEDVTKLVYCIDGLSYEIFEYAQNDLGLFKQFKTKSKMVSTFPSISQYAWSVITGSSEIDPRRGRTQFPESAYFSDFGNELNQDSRNFFVHAFNKNSNSVRIPIKANLYLESLGYISKTEVRKHEIHDVEEQILESSNKALIISMAAGLDGVAHLHKGQLEDTLNDIDLSLKHIAAEFEAQGRDLEIVIVSDHGQASQFFEGEEEVSLLSADVATVVESAGLDIVGKLENDNDVVIPVLALANYVSFYFQDAMVIPKLVEKLKEQDWFDLAVYREFNNPIQEMEVINNDKIEVYVDSNDGKALISYDKLRDTYFYKNLTGNPLQVDDDLQEQWLTKEDLDKNLSNATYPDGIFRIIDAASNRDINFPDMILTMKDTHKIVGSLDSFVDMIRTHGSLSARSSLGTLASTREDVDYKEYVRASDVLETIELRPMDIYNLSSGNLEYTGTLDTGLGNLNSTYISGFMTKGVDLSRYILDGKTIQNITSEVSLTAEQIQNGDFITNGSIGMESGAGLSTLLTPSEIGDFIDEGLKLRDINKLKASPVVAKIKAKLENKFKSSHQKVKSVSFFDSARDPDLLNLTNAIKQIGMKIYSLPFLLNSALTMPEFDQIDDPRDVEFYQNWLADRENFLNIIDPHWDYDPNSSFATLFENIFEENKIIEELKPMEVRPLYQWHLPKEITVVFVPGIYDSIFDDHLYKRAMKNLEEIEGIRVIKPTLQSSCSSNINGDEILSFLQTDQVRRMRRGFVKPKYLILGYSKGGVDTLHAFTKDPEFVKKSIVGLVTIASPLQGTEILNVTDLPFQLIDFLSEKQTPEVCRSGEGRASVSVTPQAMYQFWLEHEKELLGLTRYYSSSFVATSKQAHIWMKATKIIGQFKAYNDGVVTTDSSKFPSVMQAVNFGIQIGDHLSGMVTADFDQVSYIKSLVQTVSFLEGYNLDFNASWNNKIRAASKLLTPEDHKNRLKEVIAEYHDKLFRSTSIGENRRKDLDDELHAELNSHFYPIIPFSFLKVPVVNIYFMYFWPKGSYWPVFRGIDSEDDMYSAILGEMQTDGDNLMEEVDEFWKDIPISDRDPIKVPENDLNYNTKDIVKMMSEPERAIEGTIQPATLADYPGGIDIIYDHQKSEQFREEYQFYFFDYVPPGADNSKRNGYASVVQDDRVMGKFTSTNNSVRAISFAWRYMVKDFKNVEVGFQVNTLVDKANNIRSAKGRNDDSPLRIWFTLREMHPSLNPAKSSKSDKNRSVVFSYLWGRNDGGENLDGELFYHSTFSEKNMVVVKLPEMQQKMMGFKSEDLGKFIDFKSNFYEDIKNAFPKMNVDKLQVMSIALHHDSNDTGSASETLFDYLKIKP